MGIFCAYFLMIFFAGFLSAFRGKRKGRKKGGGGVGCGVCGERICCGSIVGFLLRSLPCVLHGFYIEGKEICKENGDCMGERAR